MELFLLGLTYDMCRISLRLRIFFRSWSPGLLHHVVLQVDTDILEEHVTLVFRMEICRLNWVSYIGRLRMRWSLRPEGRVRNWSPIWLI
jgi:hypothetical protein